MSRVTYNVQRTFINFEDDEESPCGRMKRSNTWDGLISCVVTEDNDHEETASQSTACAADEVCLTSVCESSSTGSESDSDCSHCHHVDSSHSSVTPALSQPQTDGYVHNRHEFSAMGQQGSTASASSASSQPSSQTIYCILPPITVRLSPDGVPMWNDVQNEQLQRLADKNVVFTQYTGSTPLDGSSCSGGSEDTRTTCMLRNLPNDYTRDMLIQLLDEQGFKGLYDFIYLPVDFKRWVGLGYAFVNFTAPLYAQRARMHLNGFKSWLVKSNKVCDVCWGEPLQGLASHIERYRNSPLMHDQVPDHVKPALFMNGERVEFPAPTRRIRHPRDSRSGK